MDQRSTRLELTYKKLYPKFISSVLSSPATIIVSSSSAFMNIVFLLKNSLLHQSYLNDLTALDHPYLARRFELQYQLLNYVFASRVQIQKRVISKTNSVDRLFSSANWLEREAWDMFGVGFIFNTKDLRRILTDYGFQGFPLRKDFPVTGFLQIRYSEKKKRLVYVSIRLAELALKFSRNINNTIR